MSRESLSEVLQNLDMYCLSRLSMSAPEQEITRDLRDFRLFSEEKDTWTRKQEWKLLIRRIRRAIRPYLNPRVPRSQFNPRLYTNRPSFDLSLDDDDLISEPFIPASRYDTVEVKQMIQDILPGVLQQVDAHIQNTRRRPPPPHTASELQSASEEVANLLNSVLPDMFRSQLSTTNAPSTSSQ